MDQSSNNKMLVAALRRQGGYTQLDDSIAQAHYKKLRLALFVDSNLLSGFAKNNLLKIRDELHLGPDQIAFYNVYSDLDKAIELRIIACPTLVRLDIAPPRLLVGELRNKDMVMAFLNIGLEG